jgi:hypothetical protein
MIDKFLEKDNDKTTVQILDEISKVIYLNYLNDKGKDEDVKDHDSIINSLKNIKSICNEKPDLLYSRCIQG